MRCGTGYANTISRSSGVPKACASWSARCPAKVRGSTPLNRNGSMVGAPCRTQTGCCAQMNSKRVSMPIMVVCGKRIWSCPKRSLDPALGSIHDSVVGVSLQRGRGGDGPLQPPVASVASMVATSGYHGRGTVGAITSRQACGSRALGTWAGTTTAHGNQSGKATSWRRSMRLCREAWAYVTGTLNTYEAPPVVTRQTRPQSGFAPGFRCA